MHNFLCKMPFSASHIIQICPKFSVLVVILENNDGKYFSQIYLSLCFLTAFPRTVNHILQLFVASGAKYYTHLLSPVLYARMCNLYVRVLILNLPN